MNMQHIANGSIVLSHGRLNNPYYTHSMNISRKLPVCAESHSRNNSVLFIYFTGCVYPFTVKMQEILYKISCKRS